MQPVQLTSRWHDIFGEKSDDIPDAIRRERWEQWKQISIEAGKKDSVDWWSGEMSIDGCLECQHRDTDWCNLAGLPCTVNPITTFQYGDIGMACMGTGFKAKEPVQLEFNFSI